MTLLLPLIKNVAQCYSKRNVFFDFLAHLFQLDSPDLFALVRVNDGILSPEPLNEFQNFLKSYIENNHISSSIHSQINVLLVRDITVSWFQFYHLVLFSFSILPPQAPTFPKQHNHCHSWGVLDNVHISTLLKLYS